MANKRYIRVWNELDIEEVSKHLIIFGELMATCGNCQNLGLDNNAKSCPQCKSEFKYATLNVSADKMSKLLRIKQRRPELIFIDYDDYKKITGQMKAKDFFKDK